MSNSSRKILLKAVGINFYRQNAGFFLVLLFFAVAFLRFQEHYLLMAAALTAWPVLGLFSLLWLAYWTYCLRYTWLLLQQKENRFLFQLRLFARTKQLLQLTEVLVIQLFPILLYAGSMVVLGIILKQWISSLYCFLFILATIGLGIACIRMFLTMQGEKIAFFPVILQSRKRTARTAFFLPLHYLFHQQKLPLLLSKLLSLLFILGVAYLYHFSSYDHRFATLVAGVSGLLNAMLVYQLHRFENKSLSFSRNLPIPLYRRFLHTTAILLLLMAPEILLFCRYFSPWLEIDFLIGGACILIAVPILLYSCLFIKSVKTETYLSRVVVFFLFYYLLTIFGLPVTGMATAFFLAAYFIFLSLYYKYEAD